MLWNRSDCQEIGILRHFTESFPFIILILFSNYLTWSFTAQALSFRETEMLLSMGSLIPELLHIYCMMVDRSIKHFRACFFPYVSWEEVVFTLWNYGCYLLFFVWCFELSCCSWPSHLDMESTKPHSPLRAPSSSCFSVAVTRSNWNHLYDYQSLYEKLSWRATSVIW